MMSEIYIYIYNISYLNFFIYLFRLLNRYIFDILYMYGAKINIIHIYTQCNEDYI